MTGVQTCALPILRVLLERGADVNRRNTNGETPLHGAVSYGEVEMSRMLLDAGAEIDAGGGVIESGTPLLLAVFFGMLACARLLVKRGAAMQDAAIAAGMGDLAKLRALLDETPPDLPTLQRAFAFACINGQQDTGAWLLTHGANISVR